MNVETDNGLPPAYGESTDDGTDILDRVVDVIAMERGIGTESDSTTTTTREHEVERVRNFILYALSFDYQTYVNVSLSTADRRHFLRLYGVICDLYTASKNSYTFPTPDERRALAPYFLRYLHEPCRALGIPMECLAAMIARFTWYTTFYGRYKGCCYGLLHAGVANLAAKLSIDKEVMIPRVCDGDVRKSLLRGVQDIQRKYFNEIHGIEGAVLRKETGRQWKSLQTIRYEVNSRGQAYEREWKDGTSISSSNLSMSHLVARVKDAVENLMTRHREVRDGKREKDPVFSWRGHGHPTSSTPKEELGHAPFDWWRLRSTHVPDFFEHRPLGGASDL